MKRIMIVDDEPDHRLILRDKLQGCGYFCEEATDGKVALEKLKQVSVDLVLTDLHMPTMGGLQLVEHIRKQPNYQSIPIILVTSDSTSRQVSAQFKETLYMLLPKPFEWDRLLGAIATATDHSQAIEPCIGLT